MTSTVPSFILLVVFAAFCHEAAQAQFLNTTVELIGQANGKRFYAGFEETEWYVAHLICRSNDLELATIESVVEESFLNQTLSNRFDSTDVSHYWTSGRDKGQEMEFVWDTTGEAVSGIGAVHPFGSTVCLTIRVPDYKTLWRALPCSDVWPVLCQQSKLV